MGNCNSVTDNNLISLGNNSIFQIDSNNELGFFCLIKEKNFKSLITNFEVSQSIRGLSDVKINFFNNNKKKKLLKLMN